MRRYKIFDPESRIKYEIRNRDFDRNKLETPPYVEVEVGQPNQAKIDKFLEGGWLIVWRAWARARGAESRARHLPRSKSSPLNILRYPL